MIRAAAFLKNSNAREAVTRAANCLIGKQLVSSFNYTSSGIVLRERVDHSSFADRRHRDRARLSPTITPLLDASARGNPRPTTPQIWKTKNRRGSIAKSEKLVDLVYRLSNVKEEVYGALDAWIAWDVEFPLIAVKKALKTLKDRREWRRCIQITKWMLDKGQGKTLATHFLLLQALDQEGRVDEAEAVWNKILADNMDSIPRAMFALVIDMFDRHEKPKQLLKVFADMEELRVKPDEATLEIVARRYAQFGYQEYGHSLSKKYPSSDVEFQYVKGKRTKVRSRPTEGMVHRNDSAEVNERPVSETDNVREENEEKVVQ